MAELLAWPEKGFHQAFEEVLQLGMAKANFEAPLVFLPNAIRYNPPQSPNVVTAWAPAWEDVPECELKQQIRKVLEGFIKGMGEAFQEAFERACPKPFANQEQLAVPGDGKQEQENPLILRAPPIFPEQRCDRSAHTRSPEIPEWVPVEAWNGYLEMRRRKKEPLLGRALTIAINKLREFRADGEDIGAVLDQSTVNGWKGLFEVKGKKQGDKSGSAETSSSAERKQQQTFNAIDRATEIRRHLHVAKPANEGSSSLVSALPSDS